MDTPQISRSGRVLKKSAKVKEMEDFDINELDMQGKPKKKGRTSDEFDEFDDKRVAPIKIPKISLNLTSAPKRPPQLMPKMSSSPMKSKPEGRFMMRDSSPDGSKESESSSMSSDSSSSPSSSSDEGESDDMRQRFSNTEAKGGQLMHNTQHNVTQEKVVVEQYRQFEPPVSFVDHSNEMAMEASDDETSDSALVIADESSDSFMSRGQKPGVAKKRPPKKGQAFPPKKGGGVQKKRPVARSTPAAKKEKPAGKSKPLTAYILWCNENRKRIAASGTIGFGNIGKKMGETWQALPDKEKMAWRRKAKRLALKSSGGLISTGPISTGPISDPAPKTVSQSTSSSTEDALRNLAEGARALGTSAIDSGAYMKLLGHSLSVIGNRLTEHEGQLAVSGIFSVLLDTILCVVGPLLCLTSESPVLNSLPQDTSRRTLDSIAYFMPGL